MRMRIPAPFILLLMLVARSSGSEPVRSPDVPFVPTPQAAVDRMVELAEIQPGNVVYDLGCGDGRIVITAAKKHDIRAVGIDIDPERVAESQENVRAAGLGDSVTIREGDIFEADISDADVVFLYLNPRINARLKPKLQNLRPGTRIVSFDFDIEGAKPVKVETGHFDEYGQRTIYKWVVPWEETEESGWDINRTSP